MAGIRHETRGAGHEPGGGIPRRRTVVIHIHCSVKMPVIPNIGIGLSRAQRSHLNGEHHRSAGSAPSDTMVSPRWLVSPSTILAVEDAREPKRLSIGRILTPRPAPSVALSMR